MRKLAHSRIAIPVSIVVRISLLWSARSGRIPQRYRWRVANVVDWILRKSQDLLCLCWCHGCRRHHGRASFENFDGALVRVLLDCANWPDIRPTVLASTYDMLPIITERRANLAAGVLVSTELRFQTSVTEVI